MTEIQTETEVVQGIGSDYEVKYGFHVAEDYFFKSGRGLSHELVDAISSHKGEPDWMRRFRHQCSCWGIGGAARHTCTTC